MTEDELLELVFTNIYKPKHLSYSETVEDRLRLVRMVDPKLNYLFDSRSILIASDDFIDKAINIIKMNQMTRDML